ncbi:MAG: hypothetical protein EXR36_10890 [Betaproteobacteria bacterium]|nr:hypothetical protein [Betaproteobacteria bacterium]
MTAFLLELVRAIWDILKEASLFLLLGFLLAGVLVVFVPQKLLSRLLGAGKIKSVLWASSIGAPLPLCSCGVLPTALSLRKQGATPGATVSFLIATPETGVDSISITYALMDPIITVFRPLAAVVTAVAAGIATNFLGIPAVSAQPAGPVPPALGQGGPEQHSGHDHARDHGEHMHDAHGPSNYATRIWRGIGQVNHYAFRDLLDETSYWLVLGFVLSGLIAVALPTAFLDQYLANEFTSMLVMLMIGIPIYICASASTPLAAALVLKGLNPGAALVFLLAGPATNIGSLVVLAKFLGARILSIYLGAIVIVTLAAGFALNWIYRTWQIDPAASFGRTTEILPEPLKIAGAVSLIALLLLSMRRARVPQEWTWLGREFLRISLIFIRGRLARRVTLTAAGLMYLMSGLYIAGPGEQAVESRFGVLLSPALGPGLHYRFPWPIQTHHIVSASQVQRIETGFRELGTSEAASPAKGSTLTVAGWNNPTPEVIKGTGTWFQKEISAEDESFFLTGDGNLIKLRSALEFRVKDPIAYLSAAVDPAAYARSETLGALRAVVATTQIDALYTTQRGEIEGMVAKAIQQNLEKVHSGIEVVAFRLLYVHAPDEVHDAFREVASAQEDKQRTINRAHIFAVEGVNEAKAEAATMIEQSLAFKEQQILRAQGDSAGFAVKLDEYRRAPELTRFRTQIEAIEEVLPGMRKFIQPGAGQVKELDLWLLQPPPVNR